MANTSRTTTAGRVFNDLRNLARRQGRGTEELLVLYVLERWLYRAAQSSYRDRLILKGGLLLAVLDARRPTRDADLLAEFDRDEATVTARVREISSINVDDGVSFDIDQTTTTPIREDNHYAGVRITMPASIEQARVKLALDINFGDPITPGSVRTTYPSLLPGQSFDLLTYPVQTVIAEKLVTAVHRGATNTRERDWADMWRLIGGHDLAGDEMTQAVRRTADYREVPLHPLTGRLGNLVELRAGPYQAWRRKQGRDADQYPEKLDVIVNEIITFADPILDGNAVGQRWSATLRRWHPHGG